MSFDTGWSETMFTVPLTRGSRMKLLPVCCPTVLITDWMSAFTKLTVIFSSSEGAAAEVAAAGASAGAAHASTAANAAEAARARARKVRNLVTIEVFVFDLSGVFAG